MIKSEKIKYIEINGKIFEKYISAAEIKIMVKGLAKKINKDYFGKQPIFLLVLNGSIFFGVDLLRKIRLDCTLQTISAKSYGNNLISSGNVILNGSDLEIKDKDVVIIEDIVDSGHTIKKLIEVLNSLNPSSIKTAALLSKTFQREVDIKVDYVGFEIPNNFVIGYGLDFAEMGRNLPDIYLLKNDISQ